MLNYKCPRCASVLERLKTDLGVLWVCHKCSGRAVTYPLLRPHVRKEFMSELWQEILTSEAPTSASGARNCPACEAQMKRVRLQGVSEMLEIDACRPCQFLWLDAGEIAQFPLLPPASAGKGEAALSPEAKEALAMVKVRLLAEQAEREERLERYELFSHSAASAMNWFPRLLLAAWRLVRPR